PKPPPTAEKALFPGFLTRAVSLDESPAASSIVVSGALVFNVPGEYREAGCRPIPRQAGRYPPV
ncbi:MAG: hypothetical protein VCD16_16215, partial [Planctomycetota bacterium]